MRVVIGLIGAKRAGKDTVAKYAVDKCNAAGTVSFAKCFKQEIMKGLLHFTDDQIDGPEKDSLLEKDIRLDTRLVRAIIHKVADLYNYMKGKNVLNPYSISVSSWDRYIFRTNQNTYRDIIKFVATEMIRYICPTWHVELALGGVGEKGAWLITDMRFVNEYEACREKFGDEFYLVYVKNDEAEAKGEDNHPSEQEYKALRDKAFATIESVYGKYDELYESVIEVFKKIDKQVVETKNE